MTHKLHIHALLVLLALSQVTPPPDSTTPASRDVLIVFRGQEGQNLPPVLLGTWGGTS